MTGPALELINKLKINNCQNLLNNADSEGTEVSVCIIEVSSLHSRCLSNKGRVVLGNAGGTRSSHKGKENSAHLLHSLTSCALCCLNTGTQARRCLYYRRRVCSWSVSNQVNYQ